MKKALSLALALAICLSLTVPAFAADAPHDVDTRTVTDTWETWGDPLISDSSLMINGVIGQETFEGTVIFDVVAGGGYTLNMSYPAGRDRYYNVYMNNAIENRNLEGYNEDLFSKWVLTAPYGMIDNNNAKNQYVYTCTEDMVSTPGHELLFQYWLDWSDSPIGSDYSEHDGNVQFWLRVHPADSVPSAPLAKAGNQDIEIDGSKVAFQTYMLADENGNGTNYVKLRDIAHVLNGSGAQFSVGYNKAEQSISATTGSAYKDTGTEMDTPFSGKDKEFVQSKLTIVVDGTPVQLDAITLVDDAGGAYNYFQLRELGGALGFQVGYSRARGVYIETE